MQTEKLSKRFQAEVTSFLDVVNAKRLQRNLSNVLFIYLTELNIGIPNYHDDLIHDLEFLFYFLDAAKKEQKKARKKRKRRLKN